MGHPLIDFFYKRTQEILLSNIGLLQGKKSQLQLCGIRLDSHFWKDSYRIYSSYMPERPDLTQRVYSGRHR